MSEPMTPERLAEIKACERETRDGPWTLADANDGDGTPPFWVVSTPEDTDDDWSVEVYVGDKAVGEFIAQARTAVPELLAEVGRLTPRQITTVEEIEALPVGSILLEQRIDGSAMTWRLERDGYWFPSTFSWVRQRGPLWMAKAAEFAPLLLVHTPQAQTANTA
jgi:hypothetical protein